MLNKLLVFIILLVIGFIGVVLFNQEQIMHPKRRALQNYHYEWLNHPEQHSMKIVKIQNHPELLIVKFNSEVELSKRAKKIQEELFEVGYRDIELKNNGIIVMFHGKNGRKEDLLPVAERYIVAGFTAVLVDLPAHGDNLNENLTYGQDNAWSLYDKSLDVVKKYVDIEKKPIYVWGMSLGGAYAIASSIKTKRIYQSPKAMVLVSTFDKLSYVLKEKSINLFGEYLGKALYKSLAFSLKLFYDFDPEKSDSASNAEGINIPLFIYHGKEDKLIGYEHGERLFKRFLSKEKEFHVDKNGDHHNILVTSYPFYQKSIDFLLKNKKLVN